MAEFEFRSAWYVLLRNDDGQVLLRSAALDTEERCRDVIARIRLFAAAAERLERRHAPTGAHYFVLRDDAGFVIARSPTFPSTEALERAIAETSRSAQAVEPTG